MSICPTTKKECEQHPLHCSTTCYLLQGDLNKFLINYKNPNEYGLAVDLTPIAATSKATVEPINLQTKVIGSIDEEKKAKEFLKRVLNKVATGEATLPHNEQSDPNAFREAQLFLQSSQPIDE